MVFGWVDARCCCAYKVGGGGYAWFIHDFLADTHQPHTHTPAEQSPSGIELEVSEWRRRGGSMMCAPCVCLRLGRVADISKPRIYSILVYVDTYAFTTKHNSSTPTLTKSFTIYIFMPSYAHMLSICMHAFCVWCIFSRFNSIDRCRWLGGLNQLLTTLPYTHSSIITITMVIMSVIICALKWWVFHKKVRQEYFWGRFV